MNPTKDEAEAILIELDLLPRLNKYGEARVVGSAALDLIVKPDLDIHLLTDAEDLMPTVHAVSSYLLDQPKVREVRITDWRKESGVKIGVDAFPAPSGNWSIDIWITNDRRTTAFEFVQQLNANLTDDQRRAILKIKEHFFQLGELRDGLSLRIYKAVVEKDIRTVEEFVHSSIE